MTREIISRERFLKPVDRKREDVPLPEFGNGACVPVWSMTARERSEFEKQFSGKGGKPLEARTREIRERLIVACCRNDDGSPIFTADDVAAIGNQDAAIVERIVDVAMRLAGMKSEDIDTLAKNSGETHVD